MYQNFIIPYLYEAQHVSGDTPPIIRSIQLHWQPLVFHTWKVVGRVAGGRCRAQKNPTRCHSVSKFYYSIFIWSLTCFGRHTAHHQEPTTALAASGFSHVEGCWTCSWWTLSGTEKSNKMPRCIKILLFHIYIKLNMFRATHRPSAGVYNCTGSLWFFIRGRLLDV